MSENEEMLEQDVEITSSDIVFDCPNCGHNLVVDYRAAGLQVPCTDCGAIIQVPIPETMHLEDLDTEPGELLQQLLQTRRLLIKAEAAAQAAGEKVVELTLQVEEYRKVLKTVRTRVETLQEAARLANETRQNMLEMLNEAVGN